jgi:O-antigen/teichoic acid export membrane protein
MTASQGSLFVLQFIGSVIIARLLSPYEMGIYAVAMAVIGLISTFQSFGLSGFIIREPGITSELAATAFTINAIASIVLAIVIAAISTLGASFIENSGVAHVMLALAILPLLGAFEFLPAATLERAANFKIIALVNTSKTLISQGVSIVLAYQGASYMSLVWGQIAGGIVSLLLYNLVGWKHCRLRPHFSEWRRITRFGVQMLTISGVNTVNGRTSDILLGRIVGLEALGLYGRAANLNNLLWDRIHLVVGRVLFVELSKQARSGQPLRDNYLRIVEILTAVLWPGFIGLAVVAGPFILAVYGSKWVVAAQPLRLLALASVLLVSISLTWELFVIRQETARQARIEFIRAGGGLAMFGVGCLFGVTGAALGRVGEAILAIFLYWPHLNRMTETRFADLAPIFLRSLILTSVAVGPAALLMGAYNGSAETPLANLAGAIAIGIVLWAATLAWLKHPIAIEALRLLSRFRRRREVAP